MNKYKFTFYLALYVFIVVFLLFFLSYIFAMIRYNLNHGIPFYSIDFSYLFSRNVVDDIKFILFSWFLLFVILFWGYGKMYKIF